VQQSPFAVDPASPPRGPSPAAPRGTSSDKCRFRRAACAAGGRSRERCRGIDKVFAFFGETTAGEISEDLGKESAGLKRTPRTAQTDRIRLGVVVSA